MRVFRLAVALLFTAYNLIPLYGLWAWHWDAFQLLIMYWTETVILAFWTLVRILLVPSEALGTITVNGRETKATHRTLITFFAIQSGGFILVHLFFLCVLFSDDWFSRFHGLGSLLKALYLSSGAWIPLGLAMLGSALESVTGPFKPQFIRAIRRWLRPDESLVPQTTAPPASEDAVGWVVLGLYVRIIIMQVAIIVGAWLARDWKSLAPIVIVIGLKTLIDFGTRLK